MLRAVRRMKQPFHVAGSNPVTRSETWPVVEILLQAV